MDIIFKTGEFQHFIATRKFALAATGIDIAAGADVLFDGNVVQYNGSDLVFPKMRGAVQTGWLVPAAIYLAGGSNVAPPSAGMRVRSATNGGNPLAPVEKTVILTTASDEKVIVNSTTRAANVQNRNVQARTASVNPSTLAGKTVRDRQGYQVVAEEQDGVTVRSLKTPAKSATSVTDNGLYDEGQRLKNLQFEAAAGNPKTEEERLLEMSPEDRSKYMSKKEDREEIVKRAEAKMSGRSVVGTVKKTSGVTVSKGSTEIEDLSDASGPAKITHTYVDGIKMTNTNGPGTVKRSEDTPKIEKDGTADARRRIAKSMCSNFPDNYDFSDHWKKRLARIRLDYETQPDVLKAIFTAESDDFKRVLVEEFPDAFAG